MKVKVFDPFVVSADIENLGGEKVENFEDAIQSADFVSIHMPLNENTKTLLTMI